MRTVFLMSCVLLLALFACKTQVAVKQEQGDRGVFELLYQHVKSRMAISSDCSAGGVIFMRDGKVLYEEYLGAVHRGPGATPITTDSRFPCFSVSKGFGASVVLSLVSDGLIALDGPVSKYIPHFKGKGPDGKFLRDNVTIRTLASHSSGIPRPDKQPERYDNRPIFEDVVLEFKPGTSFLYSELAMRVLGHVLEVAGGKRYEILLKERVLDPVGLSSVGYLYMGADTSDIVHSCVGYDSSSIGFSDEFAPKPYPGTGLYASLKDIARYGQLWLDGGKANGREVFSSDLIELAWQSQPKDRVPDPAYGILFWLFPQVGSKVISGMAHTICAIIPERNVVVAMALNQRGGSRWFDFETEKINLTRLGHTIVEKLDRLSQTAVDR